MNEQFARKVYKSLVGVLEILEQQRRAGTVEVPELVRSRLRGYVNGFEDELARRAMIYWIDELFVRSDLPCSAWWDKRTLEHETYNEQLRAVRFFQKAEEAGRIGNIDTLSLFYLCIALGFRGVYGSGASVPVDIPIAPAAPAPQPTREPVVLPDYKPAVPPAGGVNVAPQHGPIAPMTASAPLQGFGTDDRASKVGRGWPKTLDAWMDGLAEQIFKRASGRYQPVAPAGVLGDCTPLQGGKSFRFWLAMLFLALGGLAVIGVVTLVLL